MVLIRLVYLAHVEINLPSWNRKMGTGGTFKRLSGLNFHTWINTAMG